MTLYSLQPIKMSYSSFESVNNVELSSNVPIIIMHGLLGSKNNWNSLSKVIHSKNKRKVISVDARNHGDSPHTPAMSYSLMVEDIRQLMHDLNAPKASVIGHSMGGRTMMLLALKYPELVQQLVVADISPVGSSVNLSVMPKYFEAMHNVHLPAKVPMSTARKEADKQLAAVVQDSGVRQFLLTNLVEGNDGVYRWRVNLDALAANFQEIGTFPSISGTYEGPTLFIGGSESDFLKQEDHEKIKGFFPKATFEYVKGAGHMLHAEKPAEFLEVVCKFINEQK